MDKSGISLVSADASEDTTVNNESEAPKEMGEITPNSQGKPLHLRSINTDIE